MALRTPNSVLSDGWMDAKVSYYSTAKDKIFIADDQHINIEVLKEHFDHFELQPNCEFFFDGQQITNRTQECVKDAVCYASADTKELRPIALILLDFQMPNKTGLQAVTEIKKFYAATNLELEIKGTELKVIEPLFVFLTSYSTPNFKRLLKDIGVEHCYEKPI